MANWEKKETASAAVRVCTHCVLALSLHPYVDSCQPGLTDIVGNEMVGVAGFWHGQGASS